MEKFYSQHNEEEYIIKYCGNKTNGKYIEIGAGDPEDISNSYYFYLKGWYGLCFEPRPECASEIWGKGSWPEKRPRDIFVMKAVSDHKGEIEMCDTAVVGSFIGDKYVNEEYVGQTHRRKKVPCDTMMAYLEEYPEFKEVDFLSIDVDTYEHKVLAGMDFTIFKPKLIVIEYVVRNEDYRKNWEHLLLPFYEPKEAIIGNCFYLRKEGV